MLYGVKYIDPVPLAQAFPALTADLTNDRGELLYYTHEDITRVVQYARLRGVRGM